MCDTIVALGSATEEGFTLFGKNSDREPDEAQNILIVPREKHALNETVQCSYLTIPQISETARVLLCQPFWMFGAEMGANEYGVIIGKEAIFNKRNYLSFIRIISKMVIKIKGGKIKDEKE